MYNKQPQENLVRPNLTVGTVQVKSFKAMIKDAMYPDFMLNAERNSPAIMAT